MIINEFFIIIVASKRLRVEWGEKEKGPTMMCTQYQFRRAPRRRSEYTLQTLKVTTTIFKIKRVRKLKLSEMYR